MWKGVVLVKKYTKVRLFRNNPKVEIIHGRQITSVIIQDNFSKIKKNIWKKLNES